MSYKQCIINAIKEGLVSEKQAKEQLQIFDNLETRFKGMGMDPTEAQVKAAKEAYELAKMKSMDKKRIFLLQKKVQDRIMAHLKSYRNKQGEVDYAEAARGIYDYNYHQPLRESITAQMEIVEGKAHALMVKVMDEMRYKMGGFQTKQQKANMKLMVRELFNEKTGNKLAAELAAGWKAASEYLRKSFNQSGGKIVSRLDWGLPQIHDTLLVRSVSKEEWIEYVLPKLDIKKMIDERSGLPFNDKTIILALDEVYENISTDGFSKFKPSGNRLGRSLHNRRTDHRFLVFKNADNWMEYQAKFGKSDPYAAMMDHIKGMSRDIALMRSLGANPDATHTWLKGVVKKQAAINARDEAQGKFSRQIVGAKTFANEADRTTGILDNIDNMYAYHKGNLHNPVNGFFGRSFAALRQILTAAQLGGASIMALSDFNWSRITSKFNGLPAFKANQYSLKLLKEGVKKDKALMRTAVRLGLIAEMWSAVSAVQMRYMATIDAPIFSKRVSDLVLRGSGLSHLTQAGKWGFGMAIMGELAEQAAKPFSKLDAKLQAAMKKYGIADGEWEIIRKTKLYDAAIDEPSLKGQKGMTFLRPDDILARTDLADNLKDDLTTKLLNLVSTENKFAVPTSSTRGRMILANKAQPGTIAGEFIQSALMYKSFAIALGFTHLARGFAQQGLKGKAKYLVPMLITGTLMGALSYEIKQIVAGKTPTDPSKMGFRYWLAAMVYGGGLGIFGDFLFEDRSRFGKDLGTTAAGPVVGFLGDTIDLTIGNAFQLINGDKTNFGSEFSNFLQRYTPGSSLWYWRLAYERLIIDSLEQMINPDFHTKHNRQKNRIYNDFGQEYWWEPGELLPN